MSTESSVCGESLGNPYSKRLQAPLPVAHLLQKSVVRQVELQGSHRDVAFSERRHIRIRVRIGTTEIRSGPEVDSAAWVDAAVEALDVRGQVLRQGPDAPYRSLVQTRDVDVEECPRPRLMSQDLLDDAARQLGAAREIELRLDVFQRNGDAGALKKGSFNGGGGRARIKNVDP